MNREDLSDLVAFTVIAEERSFRRAAQRLGVSPSALSHTLRRLEARLGVALLLRTTRSLAPTEAGSRLLGDLQPALQAIDRSLADAVGRSDQVAGLVRINPHRDAAEQVLLPRLASLRSDYPDLRIELMVDDGITDVVAAGCDAGVRSGERLDQDMIAVRLTDAQRTAVVAAPGYLAGAPALRGPEDLARHRCIGYRHVTARTLHRWRFERDGCEVEAGLSFDVVVDDVHTARLAALHGMGLCYLLRRSVNEQLHAGSLVEVLQDWSVSYPGDFLYYPSRRTLTPAMRALIERLRLRPTA